MSTVLDVGCADGALRAALPAPSCFPDTASIAVALLDQYERRLQQELISGAPPLGPGAPSAQRLAAFYAVMVELLDEHLPLALGGESGAARFAAGAYGFWHTRVHAPLVETRVPDPDTLVDILLAPLAPDVYRFQRHEPGRPPAIADTLAWQADELLAHRAPNTHPRAWPRPPAHME